VPQNKEKHFVFIFILCMYIAHMQKANVVLRVFIRLIKKVFNMTFYDQG